MKKRLKSFIAGIAASVLLLAGCQPVGSLNLDQMLLNGLEVKSAEMNQTVTFDLLVDETQIPDERVATAIRLLDPLTIQAHTVLQDQHNISVDGSIVIPKGTIPFKLSMNENEMTVQLDNAIVPLTVDLPSSEMADSSLYEQAIKDLAQVIVRNLPNPKHISVKSDSKAINGRTLNGHTVNAEIYGPEIPELVLSFVKNVAKDKEGIRQALEALAQLDVGFTESERITEEDVVEVQQFLREGIEEMEAELEQTPVEEMLSNDTYIKTEFFVDSLLRQRRTKTEIAVVVPEQFRTETEGFNGINITVENEIWNINQALQADQLDSTDALNADNMTSPREFLATLDKENSVLYDLIVNDLQLTTTVAVLTLDKTEVYKDDLYFEIDAAPFSKNGRAFVPLTFFSNTFGSSYSWNDDTREVTLYDGELEIVFKVGSDEAKVNGEVVKLPATTEIRNGKFMVPVAFVSEQLGADISYDPATSTITIVRTIE